MPQGAPTPHFFVVLNLLFSADVVLKAERKSLLLYRHAAPVNRVTEVIDSKADIGPFPRAKARQRASELASLFCVFAEFLDELPGVLEMVRIISASEISRSGLV